MLYLYIIYIYIRTFLWRSRRLISIQRSSAFLIHTFMWIEKERLPCVDTDHISQPNDISGLVTGVLCFLTHHAGILLSHPGVGLQTTVGQLGLESSIRHERGLWILIRTLSLRWSKNESFSHLKMLVQHYFSDWNLLLLVWWVFWGMRMGVCGTFYFVFEAQINVHVSFSTILFYNHLMKICMHTFVLLMITLH